MNKEILLVVDAVSNEKGVSREVIFQAIEAALATATRKRHGGDIDVRVSIHRDTGEYETFRRWEVIGDDQEREFPDRQLYLDQAQEIDPAAEIGGHVEVPMEAGDYGRIAAQAAKQVIMQKVREAEREQIVKEYSTRKGEMVTGVVKRMERGDAIVDLGGGVEAKLEKKKMIPREGLRPGDRIRAILEDVRPEPRGPQLFLSRIGPELLVELFKLEVPEVGEGLIEIHGAARDPGLRAKIAVHSKDPKIDPVGACVGIRGSRVQSVSNEIAGERVDIIKWSPDPAQFILNALAPAEALSVVVDEEAHSLDVIVDENQLSLAIGRNGQNVKLASELTGWEVNILTEQEAEAKSESEAEAAIRMFMERLDVGEDVAGILVQEGFTTIDEVAYVPRQELLDIEEFDEELVDELRKRAEDALLIQAIAEEERRKAAQPAEDLLEMEGMDEDTAYLLASHGIRTREDLAEQSVDDLMEAVEGMEDERARELIMTARAPWFEAQEAQEGEQA